MGPLQVHLTGQKTLLHIHLDLSILGFQIPYMLARIEHNSLYLVWKVLVANLLPLTNPSSQSSEPNST